MTLSSHFVHYLTLINFCYYPTSLTHTHVTSQTMVLVSQRSSNPVSPQNLLTPYCRRGRNSPLNVLLGDVLLKAKEALSSTWKWVGAFSVQGWSGLVLSVAGGILFLVDGQTVYICRLSLLNSFQHNQVGWVSGMGMGSVNNSVKIEVTILCLLDILTILLSEMVTSTCIEYPRYMAIIGALVQIQKEIFNLALQLQNFST